MKKEELRKLIDSLSCDIDFEFNGVHGSICPFNRFNIALSYRNKTVECGSVDEAMSCPFIDGKTLNDVSGKLEIY